ncbi:hypothetical protein N7523_005586 [Penicillium sp. IBT 18751x]|nr:hypothetical protein N7523_005827 [Penicillium sp. IBT 18751x]KAJ6117835.1 hypothetical protein N7523_005586 [Penicillium sp. IBT 18751x]
MTNAEEVIFYLHNNPHVHSRGIEAVVAALNIQNRRQDSDAFILAYRDSVDMPLQTVALLQARFNLDFPVSWSTCSAGILEKCLLAAATSGNIKLFVNLEQLLLAAGNDIQIYAAANAAVRSDHVEVLRELESTFGAEFRALPLSSLMEAAVKASSANVVQFFLELDPSIDLEYPNTLALCFCDLGVLRQLKMHSPHIQGSYLPDGQLQIEYVLARSFASWEDKSKVIEFLVSHAFVDINATGKHGLTVMHIAAGDNDIDALKLFENLGANMNCLGVVEQTPAEFALCNGYNIPFIGCSSLPAQLLATKRKMAKAIIENYRDASFTWQRKCSGFQPALDEAESKSANLWAKRIGLETLQGLLSIIPTPMFKSVEKLQRILAGFDKELVDPNALRLRDVDDVQDILNKFLNRQYPDDLLTRLACYSAPKLAAIEIKHLQKFVNSKTGRAFHLGKCAFAREEQIIWLDFNRAITRI